MQMAIDRFVDYYVPAVQLSLGKGIRIFKKDDVTTALFSAMQDEFSTGPNTDPRGFMEYDKGETSNEIGTRIERRRLLIPSRSNQCMVHINFNPKGSIR